MLVMNTESDRVLSREHFQSLLDAIQVCGYRVLGPVLKDSAIVYGDVRQTEDLPVGWTDEQEGGRYRVKRRGDDALFGYNVGPHSWKKYLFPPRRKLFSAERTADGIRITESTALDEKLAFLGIRACEMHALAIQDKVFLHGPSPDAYYASVREKLLLVSVQCAQAGATCFCVSMGTGPKSPAGFDLAITEICEPGRHEFLLHAGTPAGRRILAGLPAREAEATDRSRADAILDATSKSMGRTLDTTGIRDLLYRNAEHPRWEAVASRCLTCANCTMACPTCFCSSVEDTTDLTGQHAERWRSWDSCFTLDFSYVHGGGVRNSVSSRYRQWMTHKLASWHDQFDSSGCVGCGRCITWCPVGIDLTEETTAIRTTEAPHVTA